VLKEDGEMFVAVSEGNQDSHLQKSEEAHHFDLLVLASQTGSE